MVEQAEMKRTRGYLLALFVCTTFYLFCINLICVINWCEFC